MTHFGKKGVTFVSLLLVAVLAFTIGTAVTASDITSHLLDAFPTPILSPFPFSEPADKVTPNRGTFSYSNL